MLFGVACNLVAFARPLAKMMLGDAGVQGELIHDKARIQ